jgi:hypothetical protein
MRRAPSISMCGYDDDFALIIAWTVDTFFPDAEPPEDVWVEVNDQRYRAKLGAAARELTIPSAELAKLPGDTVKVGVVFAWSGFPDTALRAELSVGLRGAGGGVKPPAERQQTPTVTLVAIQPRTLTEPNRITIAWKGYSYTSGRVVWGTSGAARRESGFTPGGGSQPNYSGSFTTTAPLEPRAMYEFVVEVKNAHQGRTFTSPPLAIRAAANIRSVRDFLKASGAASHGSLRAAFGNRSSLRGAML